MKNKISLFRSKNIKFIKLKVFTFGLLCINFLSLHAQTMEYLEDGKYEFDTEFPNSDLHFYLFDDGYHSFDKNVIHTYINTSLPAIPTLYHSEPYEIDDPEESSFLDVDEGVIYAGATILEFSNQIEVKRSWNMVEQKENFFILMFENVDDSEIISGCVEFHFDKNEIQIPEDKILDNYGNGWVDTRTIEDSEYNGFSHKYKWNFYNMQPKEQRFVYIPAECLKDVFSVINTRGVLKIDNCDVIIPENSKLDGSNEEIYFSEMYTLESIVSNFPHDPNCILTDPQCLEQEWGAQTVNYKVYFQNDGLHPVQNVYIDIFTNGDINFDNIELTNSSHYCKLSWEEGFIDVTFPDIYLPGTGQDPLPNTYEETIGWVEMEICFNLISNVANSVECINSNGKITFDEQLPLPISNSLCTSSICQDNVEIVGADCPESENYQEINGTGSKIVNINNAPKEDNFQILPNISQGQIKITGLNNYLDLHYSIVSLHGEIVKNINLKPTRKIDLSNLPKGIYYISIFNNSYSQTKKFVKL